jgi:two-component system NtrC family sensor kinase
MTIEATKTKRILLVLAEESTISLLEHNILGKAPYQVSVARSGASARKTMRALRPDLLILGTDLPDEHHIALAEDLLKRQPTLPIILFTDGSENTLPREAMRLGLVDWLTPPIKAADVIASVERGLERSRHWGEWLRLESARYTGPLLKRVDELSALAAVGRAVSAELNIEGVLTTVLQAAVDLTMADAGSIQLIDPESGDLYMRAARNLEDELVRTFRLPVKDTYAGQVVRTGEPLLLTGGDPHKIQTQYLVYSLLYVPLKISGKPIGVLAIENRVAHENFEPHHVTLMSALADYAAIALENADLYQATERERAKLESILTEVKDGVLILDPEGAIVLLNQTIRNSFALPPGDLTGKRPNEVFDHKDLLQALSEEGDNPLGIPEVRAPDERTYSVRLSAIEGVGTAAILHDVSYLKELDRVKTEFVSMVSHDLRSPLTSILGYIELLPRMGELNEQQLEFIKRVRQSVHNITDLISDLLHLGQLEAGLNEDMELVSFGSLVHETVFPLRQRAEERDQILDLVIPDKLPRILGNPTQLRQVIDNLVSNAIKYTPEKGFINIFAEVQDEQLIFSVVDNGAGIPAEEQSKIFDRFYRATNAPRDVQGTGLGLHITKTIVEKHDGRIWLQSTRSGTSFFVVFPIAKK